MWEKLNKIIDDYFEGITLDELTALPDDAGDYII